MAALRAPGIKMLELDEAVAVAPHSVWLNGPRETAEGIGARGLAYQPHSKRTPVAVEPHLLVLYVGGHIRELQSPRPPGAEIAARAIGDRLLVQLLRSHCELERREETAAFDAATCARLEAHIALNLAERLELPQLARVAGYGIPTFCRRFRQTYDQAPADFVRARRVEAARQLLGSTGHSISEIALSCGFADQSHLTRCFKQHFGVTPARWRTDEHG